MENAKNLTPATTGVAPKTGVTDEKPALTVVKDVPKEESVDPAKAKVADKKIAKKAPKARPVEELVNVPPKNMTDKEKDKFITFLQEQLTVAENKIAQFKQNSEAAFTQMRQMEDNFDAMEAYYRDRMAFIQNNAKNFYQSICLATKGDVK